MMLGWVIAFVLGWFSHTGDLPSNPDVQGIASEFGAKGDKWIGGNLFCRPDERVSLTEHQCAHRRYKCGTILIIENQRNGNRSWCEVVDHGSYGANVFVKSKDGLRPVLTSSGRMAWYVKKKFKHKPPARLCPPGEECVGRWRGELDMSPAVTDDLDHNGLEKVKAYRLNRLIRHIRFMTKKRSRRSS